MEFPDSGQIPSRLVDTNTNNSLGRFGQKRHFFAMAKSLILRREVFVKFARFRRFCSVLSISAIRTVCQRFALLTGFERNFN